MKLLFAIGGAALAMTLSFSSPFGAGGLQLSSAAAQMAACGEPNFSYTSEDKSEKSVWCAYQPSTAQRDFYLSYNNGKTYGLQRSDPMSCLNPGIKALIKAQIGAGNCSTVCAPTTC